MNSYFRPVIAGVLLCAVHRSAAAQTRNEWSIQGSALYSGLGGSPYRGIKPGRGFEVQGRKRINPFWSIGCGVQATHHTMESPSGRESLQGLFCEPRRLVDINSEHFFPYVSGRASILSQHLTSGDVMRRARGFTANLGTGILTPIISLANYPALFEIGASAGYTEFGDFITTSENGTTIEKKDPNGGGWNYTLRAGLSVGLPWGNSRK